MRLRNCLLLALCLGCLAATAFAADSSWPGFRGRGDSIATEGSLPLKWDDTHNIAWKCSLPGYGQSSPVVWNGRAYVTSVVGDNKEKLGIVCVNVADGTIVWKKEYPSSQTAKATDYISRAAPTPLVDQDRLYVFFESGDFLALSHGGETIWSRCLTKDYGPYLGNHGIGSSPAQTADTVFVLTNHEGPSYLLALDKKTGKTLWKKDRPSKVSWSSPIVTVGPAGAELFVSANGVAQAFQATDGTLLWEVAGLKGNTTASPTLTAAGVLIGSSQAGQNLLIRRDAAAKVEASPKTAGPSDPDARVVWRAEGVSSSFGSPLIYHDRAYFVSKSSVAYAVDLREGKTVWTHRLPDSTWASPVGHGDRVYFFGKGGVTVVARAGDNYESLAEN